MSRLSIRTLCAAQLAAAVAPAPLEEVLASLVRSGAIRGYDVEGDVVAIAGDLTALELALRHLDEEPMLRLGDDVERGFRVSSDVNGRRGAPTARAADAAATSAYYERAAVLLNDPSLSPRAQRIWELHVEGLSEERIAARLGMARRRVVQQLSILRCKAGITKEVMGWAARTGSRDDA